MAGDALDTVAYERIVRDFRQPYLELWHPKSQNVLYLYDLGDGRLAKIAITMEESGAVVDSGFYTTHVAIEGALKGGDLFRIE